MDRHPIFKKLNNLFWLFFYYFHKNIRTVVFFLKMWYNGNVMDKKRRNPASKIVLSFIAVILVGAILLSLPIASNDGTWTSLFDTLFTSTSAVCVTGLIVTDTAVHYSLFGQIVILLLIQIGGIGFITLTSLIFLIVGKKIKYTGRRTLQESLSQDTNQGVIKHVKRVIILVFSVEFLGVLLLAPSFIEIYGVGDGIYKSIFISVSAFCNAGFDVVGVTGSEFASLAPLAENSLVLIPIMFLIVVGGLGYLVIFDVLGNLKRKTMSMHSKIVISLTAILVFGGAILYMVLEWNNPNTLGKFGLWDKIVNAFFQSVTTRTAGFATIDQSALRTSSLLLTYVLMFIGGSPASTAGGVKTTTIFILLVVMFRRANAKGDIVYKKKRIGNGVIRKSMRVVLISILLIIVSILTICLVEGENFTPTQITYEVISAISTVGLTMGITPLLHVASKMIIMVLMFVGRVGTATLTLAFVSKQQYRDIIEYPDSKMMVG